MGASRYPQRAPRHRRHLGDPYDRRQVRRRPPGAEAGNDIVAVSANKRTILFRFVNYGWVDGFDFATRCSAGFSASFYIGGNLASTTSIHLGERPPSARSTNPFRVQRGQAAVVSDSLRTAATAVPLRRYDHFLIPLRRGSDRWIGARSPEGHSPPDRQAQAPARLTAPAPF